MNGKDVAVFHEEDPASIPWGTCDADFFCESTGVFTAQERAELHIEGGCNNFIISAPPKDAAPIYVVVLHHKNHKKTGTVVSNASCTANCLAPLTKVVNDKFGIFEDLMTTVHAMTATQSTVNGPPRGGKDWLGGRCASQRCSFRTTSGAPTSQAC